MASDRTRKTPEAAAEPLDPDFVAALAELDALGITEPIVIDGQPGHRITPFGTSLTKEQMVQIVLMQHMAVRH
jgi:hypothetical protein